MREDKEQLEQKADALSKQLAAVMQAKYQTRGTEFDAETPIDKVLNIMHTFIDKVGVWKTLLVLPFGLVGRSQKEGVVMHSRSGCKGLSAGASIVCYMV